MKYAVTADSLVYPHLPALEPTAPRRAPGYAPWQLARSDVATFTDDAGYQRIVVVWHWRARKLVLGLF